MLTLLPLRGWMGDAMATSMAVAELRSVSNSAAVGGVTVNGDSKSLIHAHVESENGQGRTILANADCEDHALTGQASTDEDGHCKPCSTCGACHSASMSSIVTLWLAAVHGADLTAFPAEAFFNADAANVQKPPIS